ncbi:MAG: DoxX family membrane protein [Paracoccaceae bacterium]
MFTLLRGLADLGDRSAALAPSLLPLAARLCFAAVLLVYFWSSGATKLGTGALGFLFPSDGAYVQVFPRLTEAAGYDVSKLGLMQWAVVTAGMWAEFALPLLIVAGAFTRLAALGMIGFVLVQSLTDIYGHGVSGDDLGRWLDAASGALILDQRALWVLLFLVLAALGGGALSVDRMLRRAVLGREAPG